MITAREFIVKLQYLFSMQVDTNWYWNKQPQQNFKTMTTCAIIHPRLEVNAVTDLYDMPKSVCTKTQE